LIRFSALYSNFPKGKCLTVIGTEGLLEVLDREFAHTFGGASIVRGIEGSYLSQAGSQVRDRINLIYTDTPFAFRENLASLSRYADQLREAAFEALQEEAVLVVVMPVYHAE
jgi:hypothetical protein